MIAVPSKLVPIALRLQKRNRDYRTRDLAEQHLAQLIDRPRTIAPPHKPLKRVRVTREDRHGWPVFRMTPEAATPTGNLMYFHGGGYVHGIHTAHWQFLAHLVASTGFEALIPMYPLVPEGGTAAHAVDTATQLAHDTGSNTILMGDSAGAQIAYSTALRLRDHGITVPLTVLISPPIDLELTNPRLPQHAHLDPWLCRDGLIVYAEKWLAEHGFAHELNPVNANPTGLGRLAVFTGTLDILNLDVEDWVARLRAAGVPVEHHEAPGQVHVYPLLPTRPGLHARRRIVQLLNETLPSR